MRPATFNLRLWFGVTSFGVIAAMGAAFAVLMSSFMTNHMLRREVEVTSEFLESIVVAEHSLGRLFVDSRLEDNADLLSLAGHIRGMRDVLRANIYGPDRRIVWSTDPAVAGHRFENNPELEEAFAGELVTEMGALTGDSKDEHVALGAGTRGVFIEAYIPLRDGLNNVQGVIELYKVPNALDEVLRSARLVIWVSAGAGAMFLYLTLFWVVQRGARLIERQQSDLSSMEAMAAVGEMAGAIAHSLRNPMAGIRSTAELMRYDFPDAETPANDIIGEVDRLDTHVRDLLNYSRTDTPGAQSVDPRDIVAVALERAGAAMRRSAVTWSIEDRRGANLTVITDPALLTQALTSILSNAIEAMPEGGHVTIGLEPVSRTELRISFTDTGKGIPPDILRRVAEPFITSKTRGLGLGLALSRRIAERFGGRLEVASEEGRGAMVSLVMVVK